MRIGLGIAAALLGLAALGFAALSLALRDLERRVAAALGEGSRVEAIEVGIAAVEVRGVSMPGGVADWPADESLRATRVRVAPSWRTLLGDEVRVARIDVEDLALAALRDRDGTLHIAPRLLEGSAATKKPGRTSTRSTPTAPRSCSMTRASRGRRGRSASTPSPACARGGRIELDFTLEGRLDDPRFSLNEALATRVAVALAEELGVSRGGLVSGTLGLGREALEESGRAAGGIGSPLEHLLSKRKR